MNRNDFLGLIEHNGPSDRHMIGEVSELIRIFPYFQSAYLMMLKGLRNTSDVRFDNQLRVSALHIADREVLYYFLNKETTAVPCTSESVSENISHSDLVEDRPDVEQTVIESAKNSTDLINVIEHDSSSFHSVLINSETDIEEFAASVLIIDEESGDVEEKVIYMDPGFSVSPAEELLEIENEESVPSFIQNDDLKGSQTNIDQALKTRQIQSELIEKFIVTNPRIEPVRVKSDAPVVDISKPFLEERGSFVTETLARIYVTQGYYSKAIDIYEKLSLKFPEKSSYFASQIEKVKELIKK